MAENMPQQPIQIGSHTPMGGQGYAPSYPASYPPYNPYAAYQYRLQQMEQAYPHLVQQNPYIPHPSYPQQQSSPQQNASLPASAPQQGLLKGRPVSGIDEARAAQIDFDGSVHIFTDTANGRMYTKQLGLNGTVSFDIYEKQIPSATEPQPASSMAVVPVPAPPQVSLDAVKPLFDEYTRDLRAQISDLESRIKEYEDNVQPPATPRNVTRQRKPDGTFATNGGE